MPPKKKKGKAKKGSKKGKKASNEEKKNIYDIPEFIDPKVYTP